ncbi:hypothetical protein CCP3SC15_30028 [Gammaproteobacteria bacterium]
MPSSTAPPTLPWWRRRSTDFLVLPCWLTVRLTEIQQTAIRATVTEIFGGSASVWLFGSRVDDSQRGGDIDLLIETDLADVAAVVRAELHFLTKLKMRIGDQKIDVLVDYPSRQLHPPIFAIAKRTGIRL